MIRYLKKRLIFFLEKRSSKWPKLRRLFLEKNPRCAACNGTKGLEVHHIIPFKVAPELELEEDNLITLCELSSYGINCHLVIGHIGNWRRYNLEVREDAEKFREVVIMHRGDEI